MKSSVANYVITLYSKVMNCTQSRLNSPLCSVLHRYGFTRISGGTTSGTKFKCRVSNLNFVLIKVAHFGWIHDLTGTRRSRNALQCLFYTIHVQFYTTQLHNQLHVILPPRSSCFSACIIEELGVACG